MPAVCVLHLESTEFPHVAKITQFQSYTQFKGRKLAVVLTQATICLRAFDLTNSWEIQSDLPACPLAYSTECYAISNGIARALKP
jgi:hypothetical protein